MAQGIDSVRLLLKAATAREATAMIVLMGWGLAGRGGGASV